MGLFLCRLQSMYHWFHFFFIELFVDFSNFIEKLLHLYEVKSKNFTEQDYIGFISLQTAEYVYNCIVCQFLIFVSDVAINLFPFVQSSYLSLGQCMMKILQGNASALARSVYKTQFCKTLVTLF